MSEHQPPRDQEPLFVQPIPGSEELALGITESDLQHEQQEQAELSLDMLRPGDLLRFTYTGDDNAPRVATYYIGESQWSGLGAAGEVLNRVWGSLKLPDVEADAELAGYDTTHAYLRGSNRNFSRMSHPGVVMTGHAPSFSLPPTGETGGPWKEYSLNNTTDFALERADEEGVARAVHLNRRSNEIRKDVPGHEQILQGVKNLLNSFGFDGASFGELRYREGDDKGSTYENERYNAIYIPGESIGQNELRIYDKQTGKVISAAYLHGKDILKVATTVVSEPISAEGLYDYAFRIGRETVTHTTSARNGIDTLVYDMSDEDAAQLGMPKVAEKVLVPSFYVSKQDSGVYEAAIAPGDYAADMLEAVVSRYDAGAYEKTKALLGSMHVELSAQAVPELHLGAAGSEAVFTMYDPHYFLVDIIFHRA